MMCVKRLRVFSQAIWAISNLYCGAACHPQPRVTGVANTISNLYVGAALPFFSNLICCPNEPHACIFLQMLAHSHRAQVLF